MRGSVDKNSCSSAPSKIILPPSRKMNFVLIKHNRPASQPRRAIRRHFQIDLRKKSAVIEIMRYKHRSDAFHISQTDCKLAYRARGRRVKPCRRLVEKKSIQKLTQSSTVLSSNGTNTSRNSILHRDPVMSWVNLSRSELSIWLLSSRARQCCRRMPLREAQALSRPEQPDRLRGRGLIFLPTPVPSLPPK